METEERFSVEGEIKKIDEDERLVFGWAYVPDAHQRDYSGEYAPISEIEKAAYPYVMSSRDASEMHVVKGTGELVESVVLTAEKVERMGLKPEAVPEGWWVGFKIHDEAVWKKIKTGEYPMFSIGGSGKRKVAEPNGAQAVEKAKEELRKAESLADLTDAGRSYLSLLAAESASEALEKGKGPNRHGPSIKCPDIYEALRREGKTKERAARISNECYHSGQCKCH